MSEFRHQLEVHNEQVAELRARIAKLEAEAQGLRARDARNNMYLSIAADCLSPDYEGGSFACDYEHEIHQPIRELTAENQRLRADEARLDWLEERHGHGKGKLRPEIDAARGGK